MKTLLTFLLSFALLQGIAQAAPQSKSTTADTLHAQPVPTTHQRPASSGTAQHEPYKKNTVKINLSSLVFNNYSFSYERSFNRKFSLVAGFSAMPQKKVTSFPGVDKALDNWLGEDNAFMKDIDAILVGTNALTGELRYYTGKHPGTRGFYVSLYGRYTNANIDYLHEYETNDGVYHIPFDGKLQGIGGGLMIGAQWLIAKRFTLDWYILGAHYGNTSIDLPARANLSSMTPHEKAGLKRDIEALNEDLDGKTSLRATVTDQDVDVKGDGPFAGFRGFGINVGYTF